MYDKNDLKTVLEQIGKVNYSRQHKNGYRLLPASLKAFLTLIHTPSDYRVRAKDNIENMLNFMTIDHDGGKEEFEDLLFALEIEDLSYLAFPTPSHKTKLAIDEYRMRIVVPTSGLTKGMYPNQFLQFYIDIGNSGIEGLDDTSKETARFFYPPVMTGAVRAKGKFVDITEPKIKLLTGEWIVLKPKPRDMTLEYSRSLVHVFLGKPYKAHSKFTQEMKQVLKTTKTQNKAFQYGDKTSVPFNDNQMIRHLGKSIGKYANFKNTKGHKLRCDCPFKGSEAHSDGMNGKDQAFIVDGRVTCESSTHSGLIGRPEDECIDTISLFNDLGTLDEVLA